MRRDLELQEAQDAQLASDESQIRTHGITKRVLDLTISALVLLATSPLWLLIVIAIKFDSIGPIIFRQRRVGTNGREFVMYKFRTMTNDADPAVHKESFRKYAEGDQPDVEEDSSTFKDDRDPRVTRIGRFLRATNLDELPQLINVLKGEMSIVGPRPAIEYELEWYKEWHHKRFRTLPGITGLWQLSRGRFHTGLDDMVRLDLEYVRTRSLFLDLKIIWFTGVRILKEAVRALTRTRAKS